MSLPIQNLGAVVADWIDHELLPKATGWQKVATVMLSMGLVNNMTNIIAQYLPVLQMLGYADSDGNLLLDAILVAAKEAFSKTGKLPLPLGIVVDASDVETFITIARRYESGS